MFTKAGDPSTSSISEGRATVVSVNKLLNNTLISLDESSGNMHQRLDILEHHRGEEKATAEERYKTPENLMTSVQKPFKESKNINPGNYDANSHP